MALCSQLSMTEQVKKGEERLELKSKRKEFVLTYSLLSASEKRAELEGNRTRRKVVFTFSLLLAEIFFHFWFVV